MPFLNFSGIPNTSRVGKLLRLPLRLVPPEARVPILQGRLRGALWVAGSSIAGCYLGSYEYEKQVQFERAVNSGDVVYDIGANVGFYTLLASVLVGQRGQVFGFEPAPRNLWYLREHLRINRIHNVSIIDAAIADFSGMSWFEESKGFSTGHLQVENGQYQVNVIKLDDLVLAAKCPAPNVVKIDVEGAEYKVLQGGEYTFSHFYPLIFLATHSSYLREICCAWLSETGYVVERIEKGYPSDLDEFVAYHPEKHKVSTKS